MPRSDAEIRESALRGIRNAITLGIVAFIATLFLAPAASAIERRPFEGPFGPTQQPLFGQDQGLAVDAATGDLYVIDVPGFQRTVKRFKPNGEPDPFSALGGNVIDGTEGPDATPSGRVLGFSVQPNEVQVAVAPPGAAGGTAGNIYVTNAGEHLIDIFASSGEHLGQLSESSEGPFGEACGVAVDAAGTVYVGDFSGKVHKFVPSANPPTKADNVANFAVPEACTLAAGTGPTAGFLFVNSWGLILSGGGFEVSPDLSKINSTSGEFKYLLGSDHVTVAVDPDNGHVLAAKEDRVEEYDASGEAEAIALNPIEAGSAVEGVVASSAAWLGGAHAYVARSESSRIDIYGAYGPQPPNIEAEWASRVGFGDAVLKARFGPEEEGTTYHVEYLTQAVFEANGDSFSGPNVPTSVPVPDATVGEASTVSVALSGLQPDTAYRYRFVATNTVGTAMGEPHAFTTLRQIAPDDASCPNQALRDGPAAALPDCRAYEMVSPVDKNGGDVVNGMSSVSGGSSVAAGDPGGFIQASPDGEKIAFSARFPAFADPQSSFMFNQYVAARQAGAGWATEAIHPRYEGDRVGSIAIGVFREFMVFSADLCDAWLIDWQTPALEPEAQDGAVNLYRRSNCGAQAGELEALTTAPAPSGEPASKYVDQRSVLGISDDSRHALFVAQWNLTPEAAPGDGDNQVYDRFGGENHLVSVLPDGSSGDPAPGDGMGVADAGNATVGSGWKEGVDNAISADGSRVYWTSLNPTRRIYLRQHPEQGIVAGECSEVAKACTVPVSAAGGTAFFWAGAEDGSAALYSEGQDLYLFEEATGESSPIAGQVIGVAGTSDDLSRIYFVSRAALAGAGQAGEPNLYLFEGGEFSFIGMLVEGDVGEPEPEVKVDKYLAYNLVSLDPWLRATRVTPDGARIAFNSRASLTGFDNTDTASGKAAVEVFTYEVGGELLCVSCNPSGARPMTREMTEPYNPPFAVQHFPKVIAAAWIPTWEHPTHESNVVAHDGSRIFFNSNDALVPGDTNGTQDVYEWETLGTGSCEEDAGNYFPQNGGCVYLISSGDSPLESEFSEATPDGSDIFFTTERSLLAQDPGSIDLYDARVGGGFPPPVQTSVCEGESCQSPPPPPQFQSPGSVTFRGPGNEAPSRNCRSLAKRAAQLSRHAKRAERAAKQAHDAVVAKRLSREAGRSAKQARKAARKAKRCRRANRGPAR